MDDMDVLLEQTKARTFLGWVKTRENRLLTCGEQRIAALMVRYGGIIRNSITEHRYSENYEITPYGESKL